MVAFAVVALQLLQSMLTSATTGKEAQPMAICRPDLKFL
jgi:hypothetical protein